MGVARGGRGPEGPVGWVGLLQMGRGQVAKGPSSQAEGPSLILKMWEAAAPLSLPGTDNTNS